MPSYLARAEFAASGTDYVVPFPFIDRSNIFATVNGVSAAFTWIGPSTIRLSSTPAGGTTVAVYRATQRISALVDYQAISLLNAATLNLDSRQAFYLMQETLDTYDIFKAEVLGLVVGSGNVPSPVLGQTGYYLRATGVGTFAWSALGVADVVGAASASDVSAAVSTAVTAAAADATTKANAAQAAAATDATTKANAAKTASDNARVFLNRYAPADQAFTAGGYYVFTHGLGAAPELIHISLVCTTAQGGIAVGDVVHIGTSVGGIDGAPHCTWGVAANATQIKVQVPATYVAVGTLGTGVQVALTLANFQLRVRAFSAQQPS